MQAGCLQVTQTGVEPVAYPLGEVVSVSAKSLNSQKTSKPGRVGSNGWGLKVWMFLFCFFVKNQ